MQAKSVPGEVNRAREAVGISKSHDFQVIL
jgi:hypothetical protein